MISHFLEPFLNRRTTQPPTRPPGNLSAEANGAYRDQYQDKLKHRIKAHLDDHYNSAPIGDRVSFSFYMIGETAEKAQPTLLFISKSSELREDARRAIKESAILADFPNFRTKSVSRDPGFKEDMVELASQQERSASVGAFIPSSKCTYTLSGRASVSCFEFSQANGSASASNLKPVSREVLYDPSRPISSLGIPIYICHASTLRPATANAIWHHGRVWLQTVNHAFCQAEQVGKKSGLPIDDDEIEVDPDSDSESEVDDEGDVAITSIGSRSPDEQSDRDSSDSGSSCGSSIFSVCSTPKAGVELKDTKSTLDDATAKLTPYASVCGEFTPKEIHIPPSESLRSLGRLFHGWMEEDIALIEITDQTIAATLASGMKAPQSGPKAYEKIADQPKDAEVYTHTASGGRLNGILSGTSSYTRLPRNTSFSEVYTVRLDGPLANGDCGSAIIDANTGKTYGHLVAGCRATGIAYVLCASQVASVLTSNTGVQVEPPARTPSECALRQAQAAQLYPVNVSELSSSPGVQPVPSTPAVQEVPTSNEPSGRHSSPRLEARHRSLVNQAMDNPLAKISIDELKRSAEAFAQKHCGSNNSFVFWRKAALIARYQQIPWDLEKRQLNLPGQTQGLEALSYRASSVWYSLIGLIASIYVLVWNVASSSQPQPESQHWPGLASSSFVISAQTPTYGATAWSVTTEILPRLVVWGFPGTILALTVARPFARSFGTWFQWTSFLFEILPLCILAPWTGAHLRRVTGHTGSPPGLADILFLGLNLLVLFACSLSVRLYRHSEWIAGVLKNAVALSIILLSMLAAAVISKNGFERTDTSIPSLPALSIAPQASSSSFLASTILTWFALIALPVHAIHILRSMDVPLWTFIHFLGNPIDMVTALAALRMRHFPAQTVLPHLSVAIYSSYLVRVAMLCIHPPAGLTSTSDTLMAVGLAGLLIVYVLVGLWTWLVLNTVVTTFTRHRYMTRSPSLPLLLAAFTESLLQGAHLTNPGALYAIVPAAVALYCHFNIPESPRYTFDVVYDVVDQFDLLDKGWKPSLSSRNDLKTSPRPDRIRDRCWRIFVGVAAVSIATLRICHRWFPISGFMLAMALMSNMSLSLALPIGPTQTLWSSCSAMLIASLILRKVYQGCRPWNRRRFLSISLVFGLWTFAFYAILYEPLWKGLPESGVVESPKSLFAFCLSVFAVILGLQLMPATRFTREKRSREAIEALEQRSHSSHMIARRALFEDHRAPRSDPDGKRVDLTDDSEDWKHTPPLETLGNGNHPRSRLEVSNSVSAEVVMGINAFLLRETENWKRKYGSDFAESEVPMRVNALEGEYVRGYPGSSIPTFDDWIFDDWIINDLMSLALDQEAPAEQPDTDASSYPASLLSTSLDAEEHSLDPEIWSISFCSPYASLETLDSEGGDLTQSIWPNSPEFAQITPYAILPDKPPRTTRSGAPPLAYHTQSRSTTDLRYTSSLGARDRPHMTKIRRDFDESEPKGRCLLSECGRVCKVLKAHMHTRQNELPEKCTIAICKKYCRRLSGRTDLKRHVSKHPEATTDNVGSHEQAERCGICYQAYREEEGAKVVQMNIRPDSSPTFRRSSEGKIFARKSFAKDQRSQRLFGHEIEILKSLKPSHTSKLFHLVAKLQGPNIFISLHDVSLHTMAASGCESFGIDQKLLGPDLSYDQLRFVIPATGRLRDATASQLQMILAGSALIGYTHFRVKPPDIQEWIEWKCIRIDGYPSKLLEFSNVLAGIAMGINAFLIKETENWKRQHDEMDANRPPQLNLVVCGCRCGCALIKDDCDIESQAVGSGSRYTPAIDSAARTTTPILVLGAANDLQGNLMVQQRPLMQREYRKGREVFIVERLTLGSSDGHPDRLHRENSDY